MHAETVSACIARPGETASEGSPAEAVFYAGGGAAAALRGFQLSRQLSHPSAFASSDGESHDSSFWCYSDADTISRQMTGESHRSSSSRTEDSSRAGDFNSAPCADTSYRNGHRHGMNHDDQQYELVEQDLELHRQAGHGFMRMPGTDRGVS
eukprot:g17590.t1